MELFIASIIRKRVATTTNILVLEGKEIHIAFLIVLLGLTVKTYHY